MVEVLGKLNITNVMFMATKFKNPKLTKSLVGDLEDEKKKFL